jgi:hypothetical protein
VNAPGVEKMPELRASAQCGEAQSMRYITMADAEIATIIAQARTVVAHSVGGDALGFNIKQSSTARASRWSNCTTCTREYTSFVIRKHSHHSFRYTNTIQHTCNKKRRLRWRRACLRALGVGAGRRKSIQRRISLRESTYPLVPGRWVALRGPGLS